MIASVSEYKGHPVLSLSKTEQDRYPFSFGYAKAKMIVESIETIKQFVEACEKRGLATAAPVDAAATLAAFLKS